MRIRPAEFISYDGKVFNNEDACLAHEAKIQKTGLDQWKFDLKFTCTLREAFLPLLKKCPRCSGTGLIGGGFHSNSSKEHCQHCISGIVEDLENSPKRVIQPTLPVELHRLMISTWDSWWIKYYENNK